MRWHTSQRVVHRAALLCTLVVTGMLFTADVTSRAADSADPPQRTSLQKDIRSGGVIEEPYAYHRQQPARLAGSAKSVEPAGGWYGYGFPASTFRWGWFGAAHYYPTVFWHEGYYGDCCRYGYRRGY